MMAQRRSARHSMHIDDRLGRVPRLLADLRERADVWTSTPEAGTDRTNPPKRRCGDPLLDEAIATIEHLVDELRRGWEP